jgi:hypothetical protein
VFAPRKPSRDSFGVRVEKNRAFAERKATNGPRDVMTNTGEATELCFVTWDRSSEALTEFARYVYYVIDS